MQAGKEQVIAYRSCTFTKEGQRYCMTQRELLAIIHFMKQYRHHGALRWRMRFKHPHGKVARWLMVLGTYNYEI